MKPTIKEMGTKPPSPAPDVQQLDTLCVRCRKMPNSTEVGHQEKEQDMEREELIEGHWQPSKATSTTGASGAADLGLVTEGTGSTSQGQMKGKKKATKPSLLAKWADFLGVLMYWLMRLTSSVRSAYMLKGQELQINKVLI